MSCCCIVHLNLFRRRNMIISYLDYQFAIFQDVCLYASTTFKVCLFNNLAGKLDFS